MTQPQRRHTPDAEQLHIWRDFIESAEILRTRMDRRLAAESALSLGDYRVLLALSEAETHTLRSSELADLIEWERSRLSHHLGRMEKRGLITRSRDAASSRGVQIGVTAAGQSAFRAASARHLHAVKELFVDALTPEQAQHAGEIAAALRAHLRPAADERPGGGRHLSADGSGARIEVQTPPQ